MTPGWRHCAPLALAAIVHLAASLAAFPPVVAEASDAATIRAGKMSATDAHAAALAGNIVLIDIRSPGEWQQTGVPASGHAITMHQSQKGFAEQLTTAVGPEKTRPIALICAVGNRSANLKGWLQSQGYAAVVDVAEGMTGGRNGAGWIKTGLPVRPWSPGAEKPVLAKP